MRTALMAPGWGRNPAGPAMGASTPGVPLLPKILGPNARISVEIAWGADPVGNPDLWSWTDVTTDVRQSDGNQLSFSYGRPTESQGTQVTGGMRVTNTSKRYSKGGASPNYPNVKLNVPIRVRIDPDGAGFVIAFEGNIVGYRPAWDTSGKVATVDLEFAGTLRRLAQGSNAVSCPQRYLTTVSPTPNIYYPLNDGPLATFGRPAIQGAGTQNGAGKAEVRPATPGYPASPYLGEGRLAPWLPEGSSLKDFAVILAFLPLKPLVTTEWALAVLVSFSPGGGTAGDVTSIGISEEPSGAQTWAMSMDYAAGTISLIGPSGTLLTQPEEILFDGQIHLVNLLLIKSGSDLTFYALCDGITFANVNIVGRAIQHPWSALLFNSSQSERFFGHLAVWFNGFRPVMSISAEHTREMLGGNFHVNIGGFSNNYTETAIRRMTKLRTQSRVTLDIVGDTGATSDTAVVGVQPTEDIVQLFARCADADQGILFDGNGPGLTYVAREAVENQPAAMTIDVGANKQLYPEFAPKDDDERTVNKVKASKLYGSEYTYEATDGPAGTVSIGTYDNGDIEVNIDDDDALQDFAGWVVNLGTVDGYQYPTVTFNVRSSPELARPLLQLRPGSRIDLVNVLAVFPTHSDDVISLLVNGVNMAIAAEGEWTVTLQCSPYEPWRIIRLAATAGDTDEFVGHLLPDNVILGDSITVGATSMTVTTVSGPVWTQAADDFPQYVLAGGNRLRVTAVAGATSPQTFTIDPSPVAIPANLPVVPWQPHVLRL